MADVIECWLKGGWDLSFLEPDPMRFEHSSVDDQDQRTNCTACNDSRHCRKQNSLALIVRRRRIHSYTEISPLPLPLHSRKFPSTPENAEPQTERRCSNSSTDQSIPSHPVYENLTEPPPALPPRLTGSRLCPGVVVVVSPLGQLSPSPSPSPSSTDGRLLRPAATAFCRISASPAADDCSAFSYCRDAKTNAADAAPSKLELCQWRRRQCFASWGEEVLTKTFDRLSVCGFYFGRSSFDDAKRLLRCSAVGTFLLRDSSDEGVPFSLSVQTQRGVTSIRIICESGGLFRLDSEQDQIHLMPTFDCVIRLIQFYVNQSTTNNAAQNNFVLLQMNGQRDVPVLLRRPLERRPSTLRHLCRKRINRTIGNKSVNRLHLIPSLKVFLTDYPYDI